MIKHNPNRLTQLGICCIYCGKNYKVRKNLENHQLLCEILAKTNNGKCKKNALQIVEEEEENAREEKDNMHSLPQMYKIIVELAIKCNRLETKIAEMQPFINKQKKKINVLDWLNTDANTQYKPHYIFEELIHHIEVTEDDLQFLFQHSCLDTVHEILAREVYDKYDTYDKNDKYDTYDKNDKKETTENVCEIPLFASSAKPNIIYIYTKPSIWLEITKEQLTHFLNKINVKMIQTISSWKQKKKMELENSNQLTDLYDKTVLKLMNIDFKKESTLNKIRVQCYTRIKKEID